MSSSRDKAILNSIFNPLVPIGEIIYEDDLPATLTDPDVEDNSEITLLEIEGVKLAEAGQLDKAIELFTKAIEENPNKSSLYNNRAQTYRIKGNNEASLKDLDKAICLSGGQGRSGCQALCQRGLLYRRMGRDEEAREDFDKAAQLGSGFARNQLVALNPYAALCNQMLAKVFEIPQH